MSLMNDMLRDLSERQAANTAYAGDENTMRDWEQEKISLFFDKFSHWPIVLLSAFLFVAVIGVMRWLSSSDITYPVISPVAIETSVATSEISFDKTSVDKLIPVDKSISEKEHSYSIPVLTTPESTHEEVRLTEQSVDLATSTENEKPGAFTNSSTQQQSIYELIDKASRALALDRLTFPEDDNAWFYYQSLLNLDAQNSIALDGMVRITQRYLQMIEIAINQQQVEKAILYLEKAKMVSANIELPTIDTQSLENFERQFSASHLRTESPASSETFLTPPDSSEIPAEENSVSVENPLAQVQSVVRIPNQEYKDEQSVDQAKQLVTNGQEAQGIELLQSQIQAASSPLSEAYLLDIYYKQKDLAAMQSLLQNVSLSELHKAYYRARLSVLQGDNQTAIAQLESQLATAKQNENFRALLAGLYQREGQSLQAIAAYRNLLQDFPPQPAYWLGLALSLDAEHQEQSAIFAYQKLLEFDAIETQVIDYAKNRITELSQ